MATLIEPDGCVWQMPWPKADQKKNFRREYNAWNAARRRCHDPDVKAYPNYGGRGIAIKKVPPPTVPTAMPEPPPQTPPASS